MKNILLAIFSVMFFAETAAQSNSFIIQAGISLPKDTVVRKQLLSDLDGFISQKVKPNKENTFILKENLPETSALLDEMKEMEKSKKSAIDTLYKAYLTNIVRLNESAFKIQLSYMGVNENTPLLRASFTIIAKKKENQFYFSSPLKDNTNAWKYENKGRVKIYFKNNFNAEKADKYFSMIDEFDKKLNAPAQQTEFYCCDNFNEALQLLGVDYKMDYNGIRANSLNANENNVYICVNGALTPDFTSFDPHDLWHSRLHNVLSVSLINKPVDEGTAYLYGGSWGLTWNQILEKFKVYASLNPNADWISLYNESVNFDANAKLPLNVDMAINALIVQKIDKEKGFSSVIELLSCGKKEKENENYFKALEKLSGISKQNFNTAVAELIKAN